MGEDAAVEVERSTVKPDGTHIQREIVLQEAATDFHGTRGTSRIDDITEDIIETLADLREAEEAGVTPRAQVLGARQRLEQIVERLGVDDGE